MGESPWKFESSWPHHFVWTPHPDTQKPGPRLRLKAQFRPGFLIFAISETLSCLAGLAGLRPAFGTYVSGISFSPIPEKHAWSAFMEIPRLRSLFGDESDGPVETPCGYEPQ